MVKCKKNFSTWLKITTPARLFLSEKTIFAALFVFVIGYNPVKIEKHVIFDTKIFLNFFIFSTVCTFFTCEVKIVLLVITVNKK